MPSNEEIIAALYKEIRDKDKDIHQAATFGRQLLDERAKQDAKIQKINHQNEILQQEKHSLQLLLETEVQTVKTQSSELDIEREKSDSLLKRVQILEKESTIQNQRIQNLTRENRDLLKLQEDMQLENCSLKKKIDVLEEQVMEFHNRTEMSICENEKDASQLQSDLNIYIIKNKELQDALVAVQCELDMTKLKECRLASLVKELEETIYDKDKELSSYSVEVQKMREAESELQGEIEILKLEQVDVNKRGNSVFGELDDRRKLVEQEYILLQRDYESVSKKYEESESKLCQYKGYLAILSSMTNRNHHEAYIQKLENSLSTARKEVDTLTNKLSNLMKSQQVIPKEKEATKRDDYDYLRVLLQQSQMKEEKLRNEVIALHMQKSHDNDMINETQRILFQTQIKLDAVKSENLKLKQESEARSFKPDGAAAVKKEPLVQILPGFEQSVKLENTTKTGTATTLNELEKSDIIPGVLLMDENGFHEIKPPRRSNKCILRNLNKLLEEKSVTCSTKIKKELDKDVVKEDISRLKTRDEGEEYNSGIVWMERPSSPSKVCMDKNSNCAQQ